MSPTQEIRLSPIVSPKELVEARAEHPGIRLLDVRTPGEYETRHIRGAYNVPLDSLHEYRDEIQATRSEPVVLICQSGARARRAEDALARGGMPNLHVLDGGINGWRAAELPLERGPERISLERQVRMLAGGLAAVGGVLAVVTNPLWGLLPAAIGSGLLFAGITDTCGMALVLSRLPYNRPASCDVEGMVRALRDGEPPRGIGRGGGSSLRPGLGLHDLSFTPC